LQIHKTEGNINTMNTTLETLISTINMEINETVISNLQANGYSYQEATKVVSESDFDLVANAAEFPALGNEEISF